MCLYMYKCTYAYMCIMYVCLSSIFLHFKLVLAAYTFESRRLMITSVFLMWHRQCLAVSWIKLNECLLNK